MSVYIGKIFWWPVSPASVLLGLLLVAVALACWHRTRLFGVRLGGVILAILVLIGLLPVSDWTLRPLEEYFPVSPAAPERVDGIIVLGGSEQIRIGQFRHRPELNSSADRLNHFVALARRYPAARLVYSGAVQWSATAIGEADIAREIFTMLGLPSERVLFDNQSRNTAESAVNAKPLAKPKSGEVWLLVTSAAHQPRAMNCFQAVGWPVMPYPVDYTTGPPRSFGFSPFGNLAVLDRASREWIGLIAYRLLDHTRSVLPSRAPEASIGRRELNVTTRGLGPDGHDKVTG